MEKMLYSKRIFSGEGVFRILVFALSIFACQNTLSARDESRDISDIMREFEIVLSALQKSMLYDKESEIKREIRDFKRLNLELEKLNPNLYLDFKYRGSVDFANSSVVKNRENIYALERYIKTKDMVRASESYSKIVSTCIACHAMTKSDCLQNKK